MVAVATNTGSDINAPTGVTGHTGIRACMINASDNRPTPHA